MSGDFTGSLPRLVRKLVAKYGHRIVTSVNSDTDFVRALSNERHKQRMTILKGLEKT